MAREGANPENRSIGLSLSSETPYNRGWYIEILSHDPGAIRMGRMENSAPLLFNHDRDALIGVVDRCSLDPDRRLRAEVRFSKNPMGEQCLSDVLDGVLTKVSVGYRVHRYEEMQPEEMDEELKNEALRTQCPVFKVVDWEPMECSLVTIPADDTVGVGRAAGNLPEEAPAAKEEASPAAPEAAGKSPVDVPAMEGKAMDQKVLENAQAAERDRVTAILAIASQYGVDPAEAVRTGATVDAFKLEVLDTKFGSAAPVATPVTEIGLSKKEMSRYRIGNIVRAALTGDWGGAALELEASRAIAAALGRSPKGVFIPYEIQTEARATITSGGGGASLVGTKHDAASFVDVLRNAMVLRKLGARVLTGLNQAVSIPRQTAASTVAWLTPQGTAPAQGEPTFDSLSLSVKTVGCLAKMTREAALLSNPALEGLLVSDIGQALAIGLDKAGLQGTGANGQPTGIIGTAGIGAVDGTGGMTWADAIEFQSDVLANNVMLDNTAYLSTPAVWGALKARVKVPGEAQGFMIEANDTMSGRPFIPTAQMPANNILFGDFSEVIIAEFGQLDILVNPYEEGSKGIVGINAFLSADVGVRRPVAFSLMSNFA